MNNKEFDGLSALVTGGSSGIGLATAGLFAARGARVAVLDLQPLPPGDAEYFHVVGDVTDDASVRSAVDSVVATLGGLDILVNNAGIGARARSRTIRTTNGNGWSTSMCSASSG